MKKVFNPLSNIKMTHYLDEILKKVGYSEIRGVVFDNIDLLVFDRVVINCRNPIILEILFLRKLNEIRQ
jgi:hypothetical protein